MRTIGTPRCIGDVARRLAGATIRLRPAARPSPALLPGYLDTAEACVRANDCTWCRQALAAWVGTSCPHCGRERVRRLCREIGPCCGG